MPSISFTESSAYTNGTRIGLSSGSMPNVPVALLDIDNEDDAITCALRVTSRWAGSAAAPFINNDTSLWETFNAVSSSSINYSWSISAPNAYNDIPEGVRDGGERVGVYGWATSVSIPGSYEHRGTLASQIGVRGRAGYQGGPENPVYATAVVERAIGVKGEIRGELAGPVIEQAFAGHFESVDALSTVERNVAVHASASGGTVYNYSFFGVKGVLFQVEKAVFGGGGFSGPAQSQTACNVAARGINCVEFGHPSPLGYGSILGSTASSGFPFLALSAEADVVGDTFRTRGKPGVVIMGRLDGSVLMGRVLDPNASGQAVTPSAEINPSGNFVFAETVVLRSRSVPSSYSAGIQGEFFWDENYLYVQVSPTLVKRAVMSMF